MARRSTWRPDKSWSTWYHQRTFQAWPFHLQRYLMHESESTKSNELSIVGLCHLGGWWHHWLWVVAQLGSGHGLHPHHHPDSLGWFKNLLLCPDLCRPDHGQSFFFHYFQIWPSLLLGGCGWNGPLLGIDYRGHYDHQHHSGSRFVRGLLSPRGLCLLICFWFGVNPVQSEELFNSNCCRV